MFDQEQVEVQEAVDARKEKIADANAWEVLKSAEEIIVGRGKKFLVFTPSEEDKEEILSHCLGRTGNLRAPALKIGSRYIIGFNEEMYKKYVG